MSFAPRKKYNVRAAVTVTYELPIYATSEDGAIEIARYLRDDVHFDDIAYCDPIDEQLEYWEADLAQPQEGQS